MMTLFGKTMDELREIISWWEQKTSPEVDALVQEVVQLRGKVTFYEERVAQMHRVSAKS